MRCLLDGAAVSDRKVLDQVFANGAQLAECKWLGITLDIVASLVELRATRHRASAIQMLKEIESTARRIRSPIYLRLYQDLHGPIYDPNESDEQPGRIVSKVVAGGTVKIVQFALTMLRDTPDKWYATVFRLLRSRTTPTPVKLAFIEDQLRYVASIKVSVRSLLEELLAKDHSPSIRAASAWALWPAARKHLSTVTQLFKSLRTDRSVNVREVCAYALRDIVPRPAEFTAHLKNLFSSTKAEDERLP